MTILTGGLEHNEEGKTRDNILGSTCLRFSGSPLSDLHYAPRINCAVFIFNVDKLLTFAQTDHVHLYINLTQKREDFY